ncbi:MAG TPA: hypothetical protein VME66_10795 [Candidatus Acidoferrales bacterium]|nr:hypothetical protein [Candidatus Acidoferrales bacterium]
MTRAVVAAVALIVSSAASPRPHLTSTVTHTSPLLPPALVLAAYQEELTQESPPTALIFEYTVEQAGPHYIEQTHRIYRQGTSERDEILEVDGRVLPVPAVRILTRRTDRYDVTSVAPREPQYEFSFVRLLQVGSRFDYVFRTLNRAGGEFAVTDLTINGQSLLPSVIDFRSTNATGRAFGRLTYAWVDDNWLIREASVSAHVDGAPVRERITWMNYEFPQALPASTFARRDFSSENVDASAY